MSAYFHSYLCGRKAAEWLIDMNIVIPGERYMEEFLHLLKAKYGSFRQYLLAIGVTSDEIDGIKEKLL